MAERGGGLGHALEGTVAVVLEDDDGLLRRNAREEVCDDIDGGVVQGLQVARLPVAVEPWRKQKVRHLLRFVVRRRLEQVRHRRTILAQWSKHSLAFIARTGVHATQS